MEQYFAVIYRVNGVIELKPFESKERCMKELEKITSNETLIDLVKATTIIKRDMDNFKDGFIFGCPKSTNVIK